jgi:hypothetical protein
MALTDISSNLEMSYLKSQRMSEVTNIDVLRCVPNKKTPKLTVDAPYAEHAQYTDSIQLYITTTRTWNLHIRG